MSSFVYLIRNGDLYKIGRTKNMEKSINLLKPDEVIKIFETEDSESLEARLLRRYKDKRIPQTEYFRLDKNELLDCQIQMGPNSNLPSTLNDEFRLVITASGLSFVISLLIVSFFDLPFSYLISSAIAISSIPMWGLFIFGNFGGYNSNDLAPFSTWSNRVKALFMALFITSMAYSFYQLTSLFR